MRIVASVLLVICLLCGSARAEELPMTPEAYGHLQRGLEAYKQKQYDAAIAEFKAGYAIEPRREFLFAWAQAERLRGDCRAAIDLYEQFVATGPSPAQRGAAEQNIERCRGALAVEPAPAPEPPPEAAEPKPVAPAPQPTPPTPARRAWWKDPLALGLAGAGVAALGLGVGFDIAAAGSRDAADRAATYDDFVELTEQAASRDTVAAIGYGVGGALVVGAVVRLVLVRGRPEQRAPARSLGVRSGAGGTFVWLEGAF